MEHFGHTLPWLEFESRSSKVSASRSDIRLIGKKVVIPTSSKEAHWGTDTLTEGTLDYLYLFT